MLCLLLAGCGGTGSSGGEALLVSSVQGSYTGSYTTSAGGSGTLTLTIGPTGATDFDLTNASDTVVGTIRGMLSNGGAFVGTGTNNITSNGVTTTDTYTEKGSFSQLPTGGLSAVITSKLVCGTISGTTTYMTLSFG